MVCYAAQPHQPTSNQIPGIFSAMSGSHVETRCFFDTSSYNKKTITQGAICENTQIAITNIMSEMLAPYSCILDLCCGGAWLPVRLSLQLPNSFFVLNDRSANQLRIAQHVAALYAKDAHQALNFVCTDILHLPFANPVFDMITWSCAIHLFAPDEIVDIATSCHACTTYAGFFAVITFDKNDIGQSLCDQYIEGYAEIDRERYYAIFDFNTLMHFAKWKPLLVRRVRGIQQFESAHDVATLFRRKSFSTFDVMSARYGINELKDRINRGIARLYSEYPTGAISFEQFTTLAVYRK